MDLRHEESFVRQKLPPQGANPFHHRTFFTVNQRNQLVSNFQFQEVDGLRPHGFFLQLRFLSLFGRPFFCLGSLVRNVVGGATEREGSEEKRECRKYWHENKESKNSRHDRKRFRIPKELFGDLYPEVSTGGGTRHDHTCRRRNDESRNLTHQAIADAEQAIESRRVADFQPLLHDPDKKTAYEVHS